MSLTSPKQLRISIYNLRINKTDQSKRANNEKPNATVRVFESRVCNTIESCLNWNISVIFFLYCEALNKRNVIHYGSGKLANEKETLNAFGFYFTVRWTSKTAAAEKEVRVVLTGFDH